jgi:5,5'-dehydrodivanillate O-demethylase oxygenase subunit
MVLTREENQLLTQTTAGTPGGELLRRYWHPIAIAAELTPERPKKRVRVLGEDLLVYLDPNGGYGLIGELCAHRGCSLLYGFLEDGGIRCAYHGWLYDNTGKILEQPFEPEQSMLKHTVRQAAYPVQKVHGLLFAYLGPLPAPILPPWDVIVRKDGTHRIAVHPVLNANWLQFQETNLDPTHNTYLHGKAGFLAGVRREWKFRPIELEFERIEWGVVKRREFGGDDGYREEGHPALFPNLLRHSTGHGPIDIYWRTPVDDSHTQSFWLGFVPSEDGSIVEESGDPECTYVVLKNVDGTFHMKSNPSQDSMAWETQGAIRDRSLEQLGASDAGVVLWRQLLKENIERVQNGQDPMGFIRDGEEYDMIAFSESK